MRSTRISILILPLLLIGLPLTGVMLKGGSLVEYLEFPPLTIYVQHAPFSWVAFILLALLLSFVLVPIIVRLIQTIKPSPPPHFHRHPYPWWGYGGITAVAFSWLFAWTRFQWFEPMQAYTFLPLWVGYIICVNSMTYARTGHCLLRSHPRFFLAMFPASALFWWFFEYLNRFVQNWHYFGVENFSTGEYFLHASLCFSTVLPAVQSTEEYLASFPRLTVSLKNWRPVSIWTPTKWGWLLLLLAGPPLAGISMFPDYLFPMLWVSPFLIITGVQAVCGGETIFRDLPTGDWRSIWQPALAALICGFFWEMWNVNSLAHWEYSVPYVQRFHIFEMPILGYGGYLPFGLECMVVSSLLDQAMGTSVYR
jgi:hypothetical protein